MSRLQAGKRCRSQLYCSTSLVLSWSPDARHGDYDIQEHIRLWHSTRPHIITIVRYRVQMTKTQAAKYRGMLDRFNMTYGTSGTRLEEWQQLC